MESDLILKLQNSVLALESIKLPDSVGSLVVAKYWRIYPKFGKMLLTGRFDPVTSEMIAKVAERLDSVAQGLRSTCQNSVDCARSTLVSIINVNEELSSNARSKLMYHFNTSLACRETIDDVFIVKIPDDQSISNEPGVNKKELIEKISLAFGGVYLVFRTPQDFVRWLQYIPEELRGFNEVLTRNRKQRLKIDLDGTREKVEKLGVNGADIVKTIISSVRKALVTLYPSVIPDELLRDSEFVVCSSSSESVEYKLSYHIILRSVRFSEIDQKYIASTIMGCTPGPAWNDIIDSAVTSSVSHNLRLAGCHKLGSQRVKRILGDHSFTDSLVGIYNSDPMSSKILFVPTTHVTFIESNSIPPSDWVDYQAFDKLNSMLPEDFDPNPVHSGNTLIFSRIASNHPCPLCNRIHDNIAAFVQIRGRDLYLFCPRAKVQKDIEESDPQHQTVSNHTMSLGKIPQPIWMRTVSNGESNIFIDLPSPTIINLETMENYDLNFGDNDTLLVRSGMGTGKSKSLLRYISSNRDKINRMVIVSFRQSNTDELIGKYKKVGINIHDYRYIESGNIEMAEHPYVVVQYESIHRIRPDMPLDLLVLDESESVLGQEQNPLLNQKGTRDGCLAMFKCLMYGSEKVIAMDAFLGTQTVNILNRCRSKICSVINTWKSGSDKKVVLVEECMCFILILRALIAKRKIVIVSNSIVWLKSIHKLITTYHTDLRVGIYTSESDDKVRSHFSDIVSTWGNLDVLMYTSTVMAGCSFETKGHFQDLYAYFTNMSTNENASVQMIGRVRDIKKYYITFPARTTIGNLPESEEEILKFLCELDKSKSPEDDEDGVSKLMSGELGTYRDGYDIQSRSYTYKRDFGFWLRVGAILEKFKSRNKFVPRLVEMLKHYGMNVSIANEDIPTSEIKLDVMSIMTTMAKDIKEKVAKDIASAKTLSKDEVITLLNKITDKTTDQRLAMEKAMISRRFGVETVTPEVVLAKTGPNKYPAHSRRQKIESGPTIDAALDAMKAESLAAYSDAKSRSGTSSILTMNTDYDKCSVVVGIIKAMGFEFEGKSKLLDLASISKDKIEGRRTEISKALGDGGKDVRIDGILKYILESNASRRRGADKRKYRELIKFISSLTRNVFGISFKCSRSGDVSIVDTREKKIRSDKAVAEGKTVVENCYRQFERDMKDGQVPIEYNDPMASEAVLAYRAEDPKRCEYMFLDIEDEEIDRTPEHRVYDDI